MGWKTIIIDETCKASLYLNNLHISYEDEFFNIPLSDIDTILFNYYQTSVTVPLLTKLLDYNINVMFCNEHHDPIGVCLPYNQHSRVFNRLHKQQKWEQGRKTKLWKLIIKEKIKSERDTLNLLRPSVDTSAFDNLIEGVKLNDKTNAEGIAAKRYFNNLFGVTFKRFKEDYYNHAMNYGYKIIASYISKFIASRGYLTQLGIHHIGEGNPFNLTYDFIETFRVIVDQFIVRELKAKEELDMIDRYQLTNILNSKVVIDNKSIYLSAAIETIVDSYFRFLNKETEEIITYDYKNIIFATS